MWYRHFSASCWHDLGPAEERHQHANMSARHVMFWKRPACPGSCCFVVSFSHHDCWYIHRNTAHLRSLIGRAGYTHYRSLTCVPRPKSVEGDRDNRDTETSNCISGHRGYMHNLAYMHVAQPPRIPNRPPAPLACYVAGAPLRAVPARLAATERRGRADRMESLKEQIVAWPQPSYVQVWQSSFFFSYAEPLLTGVFGCVREMQYHDTRAAIDFSSRC